MPLEHALLVSLSERPAAGLELARRFDASIGFFWHATHQQIYRTLARMQTDGWLAAEVVTRGRRSDKKVYAVTATGATALADWLATPTPADPQRSELAVKLRGASYGDRDAVLATARDALVDHDFRLAHYRHLAKRDYPSPDTPTDPLIDHLTDHLTDQELDTYLVLRGGIRLEEFWTGWLGEYLDAHETRRNRRTNRPAPPEDR